VRAVNAAEFFRTHAICGLTQCRGIPILHGIYVGMVFFERSQVTHQSRVLAPSPAIFISFSAIIGETVA
jgi:hypothetical protein